MEKNDVRRKIMIVIEDGEFKDQFSCTLQGDCERLSMPQIPPSLYSASEHWAVELFNLCTKHLQSGMGGVRKLNRKERRANG